MPLALKSFMDDDFLSYATMQSIELAWKPFDPMLSPSHHSAFSYIFQLHSHAVPRADRQTDRHTDRGRLGKYKKTARQVSKKTGRVSKSVQASQLDSKKTASRSASQQQRRHESEEAVIVLGNIKYLRKRKQKQYRRRIVFAGWLDNTAICHSGLSQKKGNSSRISKWKNCF